MILTPDPETIIAKHKKADEVPSKREIFWLCVGCSHVAGVGLGLGVMAMIWMALGG